MTDFPETRSRIADHPAYILAELLWRLAAIGSLIAAILVLSFFPWASDAPPTPAEQDKARAYYANAYAQPAPSEPEDTRYIRIAEAAAESGDVKGKVARFAQSYGLENKRVLDVGSGRGYLQDVVADYTGLDISPAVRRFYHKPFVLASATAMPFPPDQFDSVWSVWVLEHVPNPEAALVEIRRVAKKNAILFLAPTWDCSPWAANGYPVRPDSDFGLSGKIIKRWMPVGDALRTLSKPLMRLVRYLAWRAGRSPTKLHYSRLTPNYGYYWMADSDAINSLDRYEMALWFLSRGDECLNCGGAFNGWMNGDEPLIIRIRKP